MTGGAPARRPTARAAAPDAPLPGAPVESQRIDVGGHALHVETAGAGPPVLLLHGFTGSTRTMDGVAAALRRAGHRTIAVDLLGHGRSDAPRDPAAHALPRSAADLARVLDALGVPRAAVLGYSMGGRTALGLAVWHRPRVSALVLVGASAGIADPVERAARRAADEALADAIERDGVPAFVERWLALPLFASQARLGPAHLAAARAQRLANRAHGLAASLRGAGTGAQPPLHDALAGLDLPILFVAGAEDAKFRALAAALAARAPRARTCVVPDAGHACHLENPAAFADAVRAFLAAALPPEECSP